MRNLMEQITVIVFGYPVCTANYFWKVNVQRVATLVQWRLCILQSTRFWKSQCSSRAASTS